MAVYNEIQVGRLNRFLQKYLGIKGGPPAPQLQADIGATLNLFSGVENRPLESWYRYGVSAVSAAFAGQVGIARFRNPRSSGAIAVIEALSVTSTAATDNFIVTYTLTNNADLGAVVTPTRLDGRITQNSAMAISTGNNAPLGTQIMQVTLVANSSAQLILTDDAEIVVPPGSTVQIEDINVNQAFRFHWNWRERALEEGELTV